MKNFNIILIKLTIIRQESTNTNVPERPIPALQ